MGLTVEQEVDLIDGRVGGLQDDKQPKIQWMRHQQAWPSKAALEADKHPAPPLEASPPTIPGALAPLWYSPT
jgi:hypothetical protein